MRKGKLALNSITSLGYQLSTIICGLILPNLIIRAYGSDANGLVISIAQFLRVVSLSEFGMTAVIQSSLYKPLAEKDNETISRIMTASDKFFRKIAAGLIVYSIILCFLYPLIVDTGFDKTYVVSLLIILALNSFSQYFFAVTNSQLLSADQKSYIISSADIIAIVLNTIFCAIEIRLGMSIHMVKLTTTIVYLIKPIVTHIYISKHYNVNRHASYSSEPIKQKWNGIAQHLAYYVFTSTDVVVLTIFSAVSNASIYGVYALVLNGLKSLTMIFELGMRSLLGEMWAKKESDYLCDTFVTYEWFMFVLSFFVFGCATSLIEPFVLVYTRNVNDANYSVPLFAILISVAFLIQNLRGPYHTLIQSVGCYKETQLSYIVTAIINIIVSVAMVYKFGLIGVAIGTLVASVVETMWQAYYLYKNVLRRKVTSLFKLLLPYSVGFCVAVCICNHIQLCKLTYFDWVKLALADATIWIIVIGVISIVFYRGYILKTTKLFKR